jgi:hypothetical protein
MFISRAVFDTILAHSKAAIAAQQRLADAMEEIGRLKASCDWLASQVNTLTVERTALMERVLEIQLPVVSIAREVSESPAPEARLGPEALRTLEPRYAPPPKAPGEVFQPVKNKEPVSTALAELQSAMAIFEDVGDDRARAMGLDRDELIAR